MCLWFVVLLFCWTKIAEHATLADLVEVVSSNREYLGRVVTVVQNARLHMLNLFVNQ